MASYPPSVIHQAKNLTETALAATQSREELAHAGDILHSSLDRLNGPLRVAIAGKIKAGKSTLLNALVGEELAPTDAGECTRIITWYQEGVTYKVVAESHGKIIDLPFTRDESAIEVDLGDLVAQETSRIIISWPSSALHTITLIDTPGLASLSTDLSERTIAFLTPGEEQAAQADAVLYLMRHVHSEDIHFLEAFHDNAVSQATPVNAIGILSRADEVGGGRLDSLESAKKIAERYKKDQKLRRLCQTVLPVAGLLAQTGCSLREAEFRALLILANAPKSETDLLLLSVDRFAHAPSPVDLPIEARRHLLSRLGLFGVRLSIALIHHKIVRNASQLSTELVKRSGLIELQEMLAMQFSSRNEILKARTALLTLDAVIEKFHFPNTHELRNQLERIFSSTHEFTEIRLLNAIRAGNVRFSSEEITDAEQLLGVRGNNIHSRLGLEKQEDISIIRKKTFDELSRWQRRAENPISTRETVEAARVLIRTCEGILVTMAAA